MLLSDKYPFITNYFTQLAASDIKIPQSILFYGNDLNAQYTLANEIARLVNCQNDKSDDCECLNCKWIRENSHPAVMTISRLDNKPDDDDSKTVISIKQSALIKENLMKASEFHRVFIFCDRDENGNISELNSINFQAETANSLLKIIEEPQPGVTFIFLTRYIDDLLPTIVSRSQCFFVPQKENTKDYDYSVVKDLLENYWNYDKKNIFELSQKLQDLSKTTPMNDILDGIQNYILCVLKENPQNMELIRHISIVEKSRKQAKLGIKPAGVFDELCINLIK